MSDERRGGGGPKKPRATFGDVMLGIPAGRPGEARRGKPEQESKPEGAPEQPKPVERREDRRERREKKERKEKRPAGPLVVVKRASGVVETRPLDAPGQSPAEKAELPAQAVAEAPEKEKPKAALSSALYEEVPESQSFAEMLEQSRQDAPAKRHFRVGEKVSGTIFQLGADTAFVSLGGKSEAMIDLKELKDEEGILRYGVGDTIEAHVVEAGARGIFLSRALSKSAASLAMLAEARASGMPVEGLVLSVNKGGLEVAVGELRAFCPLSQIDVRHVDKPDQLVGERFQFRVMEVRDRTVVLSRRVLLEEELKAKAEKTRKQLDVGKVWRGKVTSVRDFGAFVDLGGVEGLIPVSELSHARVGHPTEVVKVGDEVEVEVLRIEPPNPNSPDKARQKERITLSMRARQEDPWKVAAAEIKEGDRLKGKVVRLQPFGAFVELRPGVDGLVHVSALSNRRIAHPRDVVQVGEEITVQVEKIDANEKRISLRRVDEEGGASVPQERPLEQKAERPKVGQIVTGKIDRIEPYGVFVAWSGGKGLIPASETGTDRGTDMRKAFQLGQEVKAEILEVDGSGKIRLSISAAQRSEERAEMQAWQQSQQKGSKGFGITLGDLLKGRKL